MGLVIKNNGNASATKFSCHFQKSMWCVPDGYGFFLCYTLLWPRWDSSFLLAFWPLFKEKLRLEFFRARFKESHRIVALQIFQLDENFPSTYLLAKQPLNPTYCQKQTRTFLFLKPCAAPLMCRRYFVSLYFHCLQKG